MYSVNYARHIGLIFYTSQNSPIQSTAGVTNSWFKPTKIRERILSKFLSCCETQLFWGRFFKCSMPYLRVESVQAGLGRIFWILRLSFSLGLNSYEVWSYKQWECICAAISKNLPVASTSHVKYISNHISNHVFIRHAFSTWLEFGVKNIRVLITCLQRS